MSRRVAIFAQLRTLAVEFKVYLSQLIRFTLKVLHIQFIRLENRKGLFVTALYRQRGKLATKLIHSGMAGLTALGVMIAPVVAQEFPGRALDPWEIESPSSVLSASTEDPQIETSISEKGRTSVTQYVVQEGDTLSSIAQKFNVTTDTVRWQNNLSEKNPVIKPGQTIEILPDNGVMHKVAKGDTIESIAKKYDAETQAIVLYPFNTFVNDETFELASGQAIFVPDGVKQESTQSAPVAPRSRQITPDAGSVVATGGFVWPAQGSITTRFAWWHPGIDIANRAAPNILAADSGKVITAGWSTVGYGNHVIIDHGNGYKTLYAHMSRLFVSVGQSVARGNAIGQMGTTGRSTGIHLHFEIFQNGVKLNPLSILR